MENHVATERNVMYQNSCEGVQEMLKRLVLTVREQMENAADEFYVAIHRDYRLALGGGDLKPGEIMPKWQRDMRAAVLNSIDDSAERLLRVATGIEPQQPDNFEAPQAAVKVEDEMDDIFRVPIQTSFTSYENFTNLPESSIGEDLQDDHDKGEAHPKPPINTEKTDEGLQDASSLQITDSAVSNRTARDRQATTPVHETEEQKPAAVKMQGDWNDAPEQSFLDDIDGKELASPSKQLLREQRSSEFMEDSEAGFVGSDDAPEQDI